MLRLIGIAISIGFADSLNPTTIAPALYIASGEHARRRVMEFTFGVFAIYLGGGVLIALGPGQLLLSLVPHPHRTARHVLEVGAGVAMLIAAALLWRFRDRLAKREAARVNVEGKSSLILGGTIMAVELPTAFPYFAAIATIVGSGLDPVRQVLLLVLFNVCFVLPLLGILATLTFAGDRAQQLLGSGRDWLHRHWPRMLAGLALVAGVFVILLGATGFAGLHSRFFRFMHHFPGFKHP